MTDSENFAASHVEGYQQLTQHSAQVDFSSRSRIRFRGNDRHSFLHNLCTNEIKKLEPGEGCEAFVTNVQGKCLGHVLIAATDDTIEIETVAGQTEALLAHFDRYLITEDVELENATSDGEVLLAGPDLASRLSAHCETLPTELYHHVAIELPGDSAAVAARLQRVPICQGACFLLTSAAPQQQLQAALEALGIENVALGAVEMARVEAGFPWYGDDITDKHLPQEVDRTELAISFVKGCYLGQETVARLDALGHVNKQLAAVAVEADATIASGTPVTIGDNEIGSVLSSAWSPQLGRVLSLSYLRVAHLEPGTQVTVGDLAGEVVHLPVSKEQ